MSENSYEQLDDLFKDIKLRLARIRQSDPVAVDELKGLIAQIELWFDSLVIDSLRLKRLEKLLSRTAEVAKGLQEKLDSESPGTRSKTAKDIAQMLDEDMDSASEKSLGKQE